MRFPLPPIKASYKHNILQSLSQSGEIDLFIYYLLGLMPTQYGDFITPIVLESLNEEGAGMIGKETP